MKHHKGAARGLAAAMLILALTTWMAGIQAAPAEATHNLCHWFGGTIFPGECPGPDDLPESWSQHVRSIAAAQTGLDGNTVTIKVEIQLTGLPGTGTLRFNTGDGHLGGFPDGIIDGEYQGDAAGTISFSDGRLLTWKRTKPGPVVIKVGYTYLTTGVFSTSWYDCCNELGNYSYASPQASTTIEPPTEPQSFVAQAGTEGGQILLSWKAPSSQGGAPISAYRIRRSASPGGPEDIVDVPASPTGYTDDGLPNDTSFFYRISALNPAGEGPSAPEVNAATLPVYSDDCVGGTTLVGGSAGALDVNIGIHRPGPYITWLCASAVSGSFGRGGKLELTGAADPTDPPQPGVDDQSRKCESEPENLYTPAPITAELGDSSDPAHVRYYLHFFVSPSEVWTCLEVANGGNIVIGRVLLPSAAKVVFLPDPDNATPTKLVNAGAESSRCEGNGGQALVTGTFAGTSLWLNLWRASAAVANICVRAQGATSYGGRLEIDASNASGFELVTEVGSDDSSCDKNLVTIGQVSIKRGSTETTVAVCLFDGTKWTSLSAGTQGSPSGPTVTWFSD